MDSNASETVSPFKPGKVLIIEAVGIGIFRPPLPSFELETTVLDSEGNPIYLSTRKKVCSGDSVLSSPKSGGIFATTSYFFGPGRDPIIRLLPTQKEFAEVD